MPSETLHGVGCETDEEVLSMHSQRAAETERIRKTERTLAKICQRIRIQENLNKGRVSNK